MAKTSSYALKVFVCMGGVNLNFANTKAENLTTDSFLPGSLKHFLLKELYNPEYIVQLVLELDIQRSLS